MSGQLAQEFAARVARAAEGMPYPVTPAETGFDVAIDDVDPPTRPARPTTGAPQWST
ncbi:hypothetical protein [Nocardioides sp. W7]|uniref:hypothetical protein n=1 Tax=Nocardioides sp. W7 TaxID=2931390 RepID=UPI001FD5F60F|nr:hypothetical protein [Nocardioides sp. W7]